MGIKELLEKGICPRCGSKYNYIEKREQGNNTYLLAVHRYKEGGKTRVKKCYLGPESQYLYVTQMHRDERLILRGLMSYGRAIEYLKRIAEYLRNENLNDDEKRIISQITGELMDISGIKEPGSDSIRISKDELQDVLMYYDTRKTRNMSKEGKERAKEIFRKVFSPGRRVVEIQG
jgi:hypothetical protein